MAPLFHALTPANTLWEVKVINFTNAPDLVIDFQITGKDKDLDQLARQRKALLACPQYQLGWGEFLTQWDKEAFEFLKTEILNFGITLAGKPDSYVQKNKLEKDKYEQYIQRSEAEMNVSLPRELFYGGVVYPPQTLLEEQIAEEKFRAIQEALKKLFIYKSAVYNDPRHQILMHGTHLFAPASESEIQKAEARFGVELPPSYRDFLKVSNGSLLGFWILMPIEKIGWTRDLHDQFNETSLVQYIEENQDVPDKIYYQYDELGTAQEPFPFYRVKKFLKALLISDPHETNHLTDIYPCYPKSPFTDREWEVFTMNGTRFRSFKHLMEYRYLVSITDWRKKAESWKSM